ncbi:hypothetical protein, variant [Puccinia triticina 1-1 BBBD Race 1]|uniref:DUF202 domain-containing protein n=1 Tax=Puccinia triticina (isolate 1-1 / race 1 (BBBD)) TaxID=630390 RepID=A0A180GEJ3_PUCT1|nr:hypothetical protein, variant [Puccinia triticina 1-1 BBBD Race 1]
MDHEASTNLDLTSVKPDSPIHSWFSSPLIIPNDGSTARDHLGRDRTWMQWIRLSTLLVLVSLATCISFPSDSDEHDHGDPEDDKHSEEYLNPVQTKYSSSLGAN